MTSDPEIPAEIMVAADACVTQFWRSSTRPEHVLIIARAMVALTNRVRDEQQQRCRDLGDTIAELRQQLDRVSRIHQLVAAHLNDSESREVSVQDALKASVKRETKLREALRELGHGGESWYREVACPAWGYDLCRDCPGCVALREGESDE